jgi:predicted hydrocarbon binding protein
MSKKEINEAAIERNKAWINGVTNALNKIGNEEICRCTMKSAGKECADQLLEKTINYFGRTPKSIVEMIEAINKRRKEVLNTNTFWELKGDKAYFTLEKCSCDLVEEGLAIPNPTFCLCSAGMFESIFVPYHNGSVRAEIVKAIGRGDERCEFIVHFE